MKKEIEEKLSKISGSTGFYYKNLVSGETIDINADKKFVAASVIKIFVMIEVFKEINEGKLNREQSFTISETDKLPSCGALTYMHTGLCVKLMDLVTLMIILSDNTATNILIKTVGMENINKTIKQLGISNTSLNRLLFDSEKSALGIENYISPKDVGFVLEKMYRGEIISKEISQEMISILKNQRLNGKIPFYFKDHTEIAHKTGEDSGISHDAGIVFRKEPFVVVFCSQNVNVPEFEKFIQETAYLCASV